MAVPKKGRSKSLVRINKVNILRLDTTRLNKKPRIMRYHTVLSYLTI